MKKKIFKKWYEQNEVLSNAIVLSPGYVLYH